MLIKITKILAVPWIIGFLIFLLIRDWIFTVYGKEFQPASNPFIYLFLSAGISALFFWSLAVILSLAEVSFRLIVRIISIVIGVTFAFLLVPHYGATGVAIAFLSSEIIIQSSFILKAKKNLS